MDEAGKSGNAQDTAGDAEAARLQRRVFISYASQDAALAQKVCAALEAAGFPCWIAPRNVVPGTLYADGIVHAIDESSILVLILSEQAVASAHVGREIERAVSKRRPVVALRIDAAPLTPAFEYFLNQSQWIEGGGSDAAIAQLVGAVGQHLSPGSATSLINANPASAVHWRAAPRGRVWVIAAFVVAIALTGAYLMVDRASRSSRIALPVASEPIGSITVPASTPIPIAPRTAIAVMPFANLTGDATKDYLGDGMAEELINILCKVPGLKVPARTSSFAYKGRNTDIRQIAKDLGVGTILEGSVRAAGKRIRITAQLINAQDGLHLWSETYDEQFTDLFKLQDKLATQIVGALQPNLGAADSATVAQAPPSRDVEAYRLYLQAASFLDRSSVPNVSRALELLQQAVTRDPKFARAYGLMADAHFDAFMNLGLASEHLVQAEQLVRQALALDPNEAQAHDTLGTISANRGHWLEMEAQDLAVPSGTDGSILSHRAIHLWFVGHLRNAQAQVQSAYALAPVSAEVAFVAGFIFWASGQSSEALKFADLARDLGFPKEASGLIYAEVARRGGRYTEAANLITATLRADPDSARATEVINLVYAALADSNRRSAAIEAYPRLYSKRGKFPSSNSATAMRGCMASVDSYALLGALDVAYSLLNQCLTEQPRDTMIVGAVTFYLWAPEMSAFRQDSRFQSLVTRLGLMKYWRQYGPPDACDLKDDKLICH